MAEWIIKDNSQHGVYYYSGCPLGLFHEWGREQDAMTFPTQGVAACYMRHRINARPTYSIVQRGAK